MINLAIALAAGAAVWILSTFLVDSVWAGLIPCVVVSVGLYIYLARKVNKQLEVVAQKAEKAMSKVANAKSNKQRNMAIERAIEVLKGGLALKNRQFLVAEQLNGQIGMLYYINQKFKKSRTYLESSYKRNWVAQAMLACLHYKNEDYDKMRDVFEVAVKKNEKEPMLWNLYAWCLWKQKKRDDAIAVLTRGKEILPDEDRIDGNLQNLKNKKKMKMRGWAEQWYQFHLEPPPQPKMKYDRRAVRGR